jgi:5-methylcytosine-specific restriction endonuclease McrA
MVMWVRRVRGARFARAVHTPVIPGDVVRFKASGTSSPRWQRLRKQALERDNHTCQVARLGLGRTCVNPANSVHISPHLGRNHDRAELADCTSLCRSCHGAIDGARAHH